MLMVILYSLLWSTSALKLNTGVALHKRKSWKSARRAEGRPSAAVLPRGESIGESAWALGGGGCHSMLAQQGFVRGFRKAFHSKGVVKFKSPRFQTSASGGSWMWAAMLAFKKSRNIFVDYSKGSIAAQKAEALLYGEDGWIEKVIDKNVKEDQWAEAQTLVDDEVPGASEYKEKEAILDAIIDDLGITTENAYKANEIFETIAASGLITASSGEYGDNYFVDTSGGYTSGPGTLDAWENAFIDYTADHACAYGDVATDIVANNEAKGYTSTGEVGRLYSNVDMKVVEAEVNYNYGGYNNYFPCAYGDDHATTYSYSLY